jgi:hypothetical protein
MRRSRYLVVIVGLCLAGCVTSRVEDAREKITGLEEGQSVVIMVKSYHQGNETESDYLSCVEKALGSGSKGINVIPHQQFVDQLFPWFEPRTAPVDTKGLPSLMDRPGVANAVKGMGVRYIVWLDGDTERVAEGGSLSCAAGPGGGGCFGFAWWQNDAAYEAAVWDLEKFESAGTVSADVSGTSFLPALVIPIPLIARTQTKACKGLAQQLRSFIVQ